MSVDWGKQCLLWLSPVKNAGTTTNDIIHVSSECQTRVESDTQIPHRGRTGDSGAHKFDADCWKLSQVLTYAENDELRFLALIFIPFFAKPIWELCQVTFHGSGQGANVSGPPANKQLGVIRILDYIYMRPH